MTVWKRPDSKHRNETSGCQELERRDGEDRWESIAEGHKAPLGGGWKCPVSCSWQLSWRMHLSKLIQLCTLKGEV